MPETTVLYKAALTEYQEKSTCKNHFNSISAPHADNTPPWLTPCVRRPHDEQPQAKKDTSTSPSAKERSLNDKCYTSRNKHLKIAWPKLHVWAESEPSNVPMAPEKH
jgi:hypothetical protein